MDNKQIAQDIFDQVDFPTDRAQIDPILISLIIQLIYKVVVYLINNYRLNQRKLNSPNVLERWVLWSLVNSTGKSLGIPREYREAAYDAFLKRGAAATNKDIMDLLAQPGDTNQKG